MPVHHLHVPRPEASDGRTAMPGRRSARCDVAIVDQRGREFKRSLPVPAWRSCEPAASSMPSRERRDDVRRESPARPVEHLRKAQHRHRRRPRVHRRDDAAASLRCRFEYQRHAQSCRRRLRLRRHRRRRVAGARHHQNDWGEPAEPPDKNAKGHHSDARQRSFAHGAFVRLCEYSVKRAAESAMTESEQTYGSDPRLALDVDELERGATPGPCARGRPYRQQQQAWGGDRAMNPSARGQGPPTSLYPPKGVIGF
jgi:hypothetical protein